MELRFSRRMFFPCSRLSIRPRCNPAAPFAQGQASPPATATAPRRVKVADDVASALVIHKATVQYPDAARHPQGRCHKASQLLRSVEDVKEHSRAEAAKRIDERREQRHRWNQVPQDIEQGGDERPHQKSRHQNRSDQCQQRRIFECHGRSMNIASVIRKLCFFGGRWAKAKT
jgi:hypothetical protein